jgi:hypothetical protein
MISLDTRLLLFGDDPGNAKESALALRGLRKHGIAIEARAQFVLTLDVARLHDLSRGGNRRNIELGEHVDVLEQIAELRAEPLDFVIGQSDASKLGYVANVNFLG